MYQSNRSSQAKAVRMCGGGTPSLRKHRDDGGAAGPGGTNAGAASAGDGAMILEAIVPPTPPPSPLIKPSAPVGSDKAMMLAGKAPPAMVSGPRPLNDQAIMRRGGRSKR